MTNIAVTLWGHDLLQKWNTQTNIPAVSEIEHKQTHVSGKDIIRYYKKQSPNIPDVQKDNISSKPSEVPKALALKWLTKDSMWDKQWPLPEEKLQALE